ncbi:biopolymer transporter ExbD, partial [Helicobacter pylori]|uniref:biopolymer transporter ExbD n=1 Tax=Helicobacter pylori TaxID=210 RepID=UPI001F13A573
MTPLVYVMLGLLAILMVTTPTVTCKGEIALPSGSKTARATQDKMIENRMDKDAKIYIDSQTYEYNSFPDTINLLSK